MTSPIGSDLTRLRMLAVGGAASLVPLNSTMIAVALPKISAAFGTSVGRTSVLVTVYLVVMLVGQPVGGRICDRVGATRAVEVSLLGFAGASAVAALSPGLALLVLARVAQAVFGATLVPGTQAMIRASAPPSERGRLFGILGSMLGVGAASGPIIGGGLIQIFGWRSIFVVNVPIIVLTSLAGLPRVASRSGRRVRRQTASSFRRNPVFVAAFAVQALTTLGQYVLLLATPILLEARGWSSVTTGIALTGLTVGIVAMGPVGGRAGDRSGRRLPTLAGVAVCAVALCWATAQGPSITPAALVITLTTFGFGLGFALPSVQTAGLEAVEEDRSGSAAGVLAMSRYVGSITTSLLVAAWLTEEGTGARGVFAVAAVAAVSALAFGALLPPRSRLLAH